MAPAALLPEPTWPTFTKQDATQPKLNTLRQATDAPACSKCSNGNKVTIVFPDGSFTFHSQWLHDSRCDDGAQRNAVSAIGRQPLETVKIMTAEIASRSSRTTMDVVWDDGLKSEFPLEWLRVMAPIVATTPTKASPSFLPVVDNGWTTEALKIPEISYRDIFDPTASSKETNRTALAVIDLLLSPRSAGLVKIVDCPEPNFEDELNHVNNINTVVLKELFGSCFVHPTRGSNKSFNVSSRAVEADKRKNLPNYDTNQVLLPHADHAFYEQPINVQGWYILEGTSDNTFVSVKAALQTLKEEDPRSYYYLCNTPCTLGRQSDFYGEAVYQMTVDTVISMVPGTDDQYKRVRWHPNFIGSLLCPYEEYKEARLAQQKFQEILRRNSHQLHLDLGPGDFLIWDNFRILHGREKVYSTPRTGVGQTVTEQAAHDRYRALCIDALDGAIDQEWIVHLPMPQLREMLRLVKGY